MFNWSINLTDKQVLLLIAFHTTRPDKDGSQFNAVRDLVGDAWGHRQVHRMCEDNLISYSRKSGQGEPSIWTITKKGSLVAMAILEDADLLKTISLRTGGAAFTAIRNVDHKDWLDRKDAKQREKKTA